MRIGVVSDTHNHLANCRQIVKLFNQLKVTRVVHTGDITQAKTLDVFAHLKMPMFGVYGNNDLERDSLTEAVTRHGFHFVEPPLTLEWACRSMVVVHDPLELDAIDLEPFDVVLHGHTHRLTRDYEGSRLTFNPGECAGHMEGLNAIGVLDLQDIKTEIVRF
ncbi:MAG: YfcE family phosphodiesterase [Proteobacteria bacterium]|jgi:putative phosphoesterase|nr:YfcE family phosphodiesterase [Pseudomonadota bacterium]MDA1300449.1 YfcE family phosphodiesterase [Pseudomonadota bacterium]